MKTKRAPRKRLLKNLKDILGFLSKSKFEINFNFKFMLEKNDLVIYYGSKNHPKITPPPVKDSCNSRSLLFA